jgi:RNA polymerase sigma factor FliA
MQEDLRNKLIADHLEMAAAIAAECVSEFNLRPLLPFSDVLGYAQQGLVEAANRYSPETGTKFRSFSWSRIRGAVIDGVRKNGRVGYTRGQTPADLDAVDAVPTTRTKATSPETLPDESSVLNSVESTVDASRLREAVLRAIDELPPRERDITLRHYYRGEEIIDISQDYGLTHQHVSRIHCECLRQLRASLGEAARAYLKPEIAQ